MVAREYDRVTLTGRRSLKDSFRIGMHCEEDGSIPDKSGVIKRGSFRFFFGSFWLVGRILFTKSQNRAEQNRKQQKPLWKPHPGGGSKLSFALVGGV
jgi:hypothetical protein